MHDEIRSNPTTVSALTGLPLADVLSEQTCERCGRAGTALGIRTYFTPDDEQRVRLCRVCADQAAYEEAEHSRTLRAVVEVERAYRDALRRSERLTPDDFAPGADAYDIAGDR